MTENEAIQALEHMTTLRVHPTYGWQEMSEVRDMAISALKEIQQYREIGTVEQVRNQRHILGVAYKIISDYESIGTVEECREAVEKQKARNPSVHKQQYSYAYNCSKCGFTFIHKDETGWFCGQHYKFCPNCGQTIKWIENLE